MIELPEARSIAKDLREVILNKTIVSVKGNYTDHKFTFYYDDPNQYNQILRNKKITKINNRNFYIEIEIEDYVLIMRDGANIRYYNSNDDYPEKSKLLLIFNDGSFINVTVAMYACIAVFKKDDGFDNQYYNYEFEKLGPLDEKFTLEYFKSLINQNTLKLSSKAFLATEQRIMGIGNGILHDILFNAKLNPKRKMNTLNNSDVENLYNTIINTITEMIKQNGRDTEKDIYGMKGRYKTILSSKTYKKGCPICESEIIKAQYLGGSIYYCPKCQKI